MDCPQHEKIWNGLSVLRFQINHLRDPYDPKIQIDEELKKSVVEDKINDINRNVNEIIIIGRDRIKEESLKKLGMIKTLVGSIEGKSNLEEIIKKCIEIINQLRISFQENIILCRSQPKNPLVRTS